MVTIEEFKNKITKKSRLLGLDLGSKRIGVAITDPLKLTSRPLTTLHRMNLTIDVAQICKLIDNHEVERVIVGLPLHLGGSRSPTQDFIKPLIAQLRTATHVPIASAEERLSTKRAEDIMARKKLSLQERRKKRDQFSAAVILEWYLDELK